jgi:cbb3-type cytochrome oxidase subunit 3
MKEYLTIYLTINEEKSTQPRNELSHDKICGTRHALTEVDVCNGINDEYMMMMMLLLLLLLLLFVLWRMKKKNEDEGRRSVLVLRFT